MVNKRLNLIITRFVPQLLPTYVNYMAAISGKVFLLPELPPVYSPAQTIWTQSKQSNRNESLLRRDL
jgi:hypothetical protein